MTPADYCRQVVVRSGGSFHYPLRLLPADRQGAMFALYAFCREVDDTVDAGAPPAQAAARLFDWRWQLEEAFAGTPRHPIARELALAVSRFQLPTEPFFHIIQGMERDLHDARFATWQELEGYCAQVAVAVGRLTVAILDRLDEPGEQLAHHLGQALQLTNILRDVASDARLGRVYLPEQLLARHGLSAAQLLSAPPPAPQLAPALLEVGARALAHFEQADQTARRPPRPGLRAVRLMAALYLPLLERLMGRPDPFVAPPRLSRPAKLWRLGQAWLRERRLERA